MDRLNVVGQPKSWWYDHGRTKLPSLFMPFNEIDETGRTAIVPCRVGRSLVTYNRTLAYPTYYNATTKTVTFPATGTVTNKFEFDEAKTTNANLGPISMHYNVLSPAHNVGKHIVLAIRAKYDSVATADTPHVFTFNEQSFNGKGGWQLRIQTWNGRRYAQMGYWEPGRTDGQGGVNGVSTGVGNEWTTNEWRDYYVVISPSAESTRFRVYIALPDGTLVNSGSPTIDQVFTGAPIDLDTTGKSVFIGRGINACAFKDLFAFVDNTDPVTNGNFTALRNWRSNVQNEYQFPDFLRDRRASAIVKELSGLKHTEHYCSYWSIDGTSFTINSHYDFWNRWGVQDTAFAGLHIGLGVAAFQPTQGTFLTADLQNLADWLHVRGAKLKLMVNDQTYNNKIELPSWFPHWSKTYNGGVATARWPTRAATYWDSIDTFDVDAWCANPEAFLTIPPDKVTDGTWMWFNHILNVLWAVKDKPAFSGITLGETSGQALTATDPNLPAQSISRFGIYQVTDANGTWLPNRAYSMRKYRVYLEKIFKLTAAVLAHRPEIVKSLQINYIRSSITGPVGGYPTTENPTPAGGYSLSGDTVTRTAGIPYPAGTPVFLSLGSYNDMGLARNVPYYITSVSGNTFKLSTTPDGANPVTFLRSGYVYMWLGGPDHQVEVVQDGQRTLTNVNGYMLQDQNREFVYIQKILKDYDGVTSGPDIVEQLETPIWGTGGDSGGNNLKQYSVVQLRQMMQAGQAWFSASGPLGGPAEIQSQDSTQGVPVGSQDFPTVLALYGPRSFKNTSYASLDSVVQYAIKRLHSAKIVWFTNQENFNGVGNSGMCAMPYLYDAIQKSRWADVW